VAVLAAALAVGVGLGDAAQLAALAGGLVSSRMGTAVAEPGELIAALRLLPEPLVASLLPGAG
jgi:bifunctional ADP-heptose synthase (sugar kinase/adenylyltransferase)